MAWMVHWHAAPHARWPWLACLLPGRATLQSRYTCFLLRSSAHAAAGGLDWPPLHSAPCAGATVRLRRTATVPVLLPGC